MDRIGVAGTRVRGELHSARFAPYAAAIIDEARAAARSLRHFLNQGRVVPELSDDAVRELFVKSYRLIYEIQEGRVIILAFLHGARRFPPDLL